MLRKNRIYVISEDDNGLEVIYASSIIPRNFSTKEYFGIIKKVFSHTQVSQESSVQIADREVDFVSAPKLLENFIFKIPLNTVYDNIYIINQLDKLVTIQVDCDLFNEGVSENGINLMPKNLISFELGKKITMIKNSAGHISYKKHEKDLFQHLEYEISLMDNLEEVKNMEDNMREKIENKLNNLSEEEKNAAEQYFSKRKAIQSLFEVIRAKFTFKEPFGNYNSKVVVVVDFDNMDDKILKLIKKFYEINSQDFYEIYLTPYNKTNNDKINTKLLEKELEFIQPDRVISLGYDNLNLGPKSMVMNKSNYDHFYSCLGNKDLISSDEYKANKLIFTNMMKFIITGER